MFTHTKADILNAIKLQFRASQLWSAGIQIISFLFIAISLNYLWNDSHSCAPKDIWQTSECSSCSIDGISTRKIYENTGTLSCDKKVRNVCDFSYTKTPISYN